jgi:hypothetical protein
MLRLFFLSSLLAAGSLSAFGSVDNGLLALVPAGTKLVGSIDFTSSRSSKFGQYLLAKAQAEGPHMQQIIQATGFDPRRDLEHVIFASTGSDAGAVDGSGGSHGVVLARGTFDELRIKTAAKQNGFSADVFQGVELMVNHSSSEPAAGERMSHGQAAFAFLDPGVAVMGDIASVRQIIANRAAAAGPAQALRSKIDELGSANDAWFVSLSGGDFLAHHKHAQPQGNQQTPSQIPPQAKVLEAVTQASAGIRFGALNEVALDATTRSPQDATSLADVIRFFASTVQMQRDKDPRAGIVASSLDSMSLETSGNVLHLSVSIPEEQLEQLADLGPRHVVPRQNRH